MEHCKVREGGEHATNSNYPCSLKLVEAATVTSAESKICKGPQVLHMDNLIFENSAG